MLARTYAALASIALVALVFAMGAEAQANVPTSFLLSADAGGVNGYSSDTPIESLVTESPTAGSKTFRPQQEARLTLGVWVWNGTYPTINVNGSASSTLR